MEISIHLAQLLSIILFFLGLTMLTHIKDFKKAVGEISTSHNSMFLWSLLTLIAGVALVLHHNIWIMDWIVVITIYSWFLLLTGLCRLLLHRHIMKIMKKACMHKAPIIICGSVNVILGLFFYYYGVIAQQCCLRTSTFCCSLCKEKTK